MNNDIYLMRTFRDEDPKDTFGNVLKEGAKWHHPQLSNDKLDEVIARGGGSFDDAIVFDKDGYMNDNVAPDQSYSAIGYSHPYFSLYPIFNAYYDIEEDPNDRSSHYSVLKDKSFENVIDALPTSLRDFVNKFGVNALTDYMKGYFHDRYKNVAGEFYDESKPYDVDEWHDAGLWQAYTALNNMIKDKLKYTRTLYGIQGYSYDEQKDRPVIGLIQAPLKSVLNIYDKFNNNSAEQDGPEEYRVNDFIIKRLYTPAYVNDIVKKYFGDNKLHDILSRQSVNNMSDNDMSNLEKKSKEAISKIINKDADIIMSDKRLKIIKGFVNSFNNKLNSNVVHALNDKRY